MVCDWCNSSPYKLTVYNYNQRSWYKTAKLGFSRTNWIPAGLKVLQECSKTGRHCNKLQNSDYYHHHFNLRAVNLKILVLFSSASLIPRAPEEHGRCQRKICQYPVLKCALNVNSYTSLSAEGARRSRIQVCKWNKCEDEATERSPHLCPRSEGKLTATTITHQNLQIIGGPVVDNRFSQERRTWGKKKRASLVSGGSLCWTVQCLLVALSIWGNTVLDAEVT